MHRFFIKDVHPDSNELLLQGAEAHHALNVIRIRARDRVLVLDGAGAEYLCEVRAADRRTVMLGVIDRRKSPRPAWSVTLVQSVVKNKAMDLIIQKATELGVRTIVPVLCERSVVRITRDEIPDKTSRWQALAIEAIKQCGCPWLPTIETPRPIAAIGDVTSKTELSLVASFRPDAKHLRECFISFASTHNRLPCSVAVVIGPEGDFTDVELRSVLEMGALPVTLGPYVLRSETAAIWCLSAINYELSFQGLAP